MSTLQYLVVVCNLWTVDPVGKIQFKPHCTHATRGCQDGPRENTNKKTTIWINHQDLSAISLFPVIIWIPRVHICGMINYGPIIEKFSKIPNATLAAKAKSFRTFPV